MCSHHLNLALHKVLYRNAHVAKSTLKGRPYPTSFIILLIKWERSLHFQQRYETAIAYQQCIWEFYNAF